MTARAELTISWKWLDGSKRMNLSAMASPFVSVGDEPDLEKKSRPSFEGCVSAERSEEIWWSTGVVDSGFSEAGLETWTGVGVEV